MRHTFEGETAWNLVPSGRYSFGQKHRHCFHFHRKEYPISQTSKLAELTVRRSDCSDCIASFSPKKSEANHQKKERRCGGDSKHKMDCDTVDLSGKANLLERCMRWSCHTDCSPEICDHKLEMNS